MDNLEPEQISEKISRIAMNKRRKLPPINDGSIPLLPKEFDEFNEKIGLPLHPETLKPSLILDYQMEYNKLWRENHKLIFNKSRKIGATETGLRTICQGCFNQYRGHKVMIVAGNGIEHAYEFMEKFNNLFYGPKDKGWEDLNKKQWAYSDLVDSYRKSRIDLSSGVTINSYAAVPNALRSQENVKCVFISEAAHINRLEDRNVYNAIRPIAANDPNVDFIMESTPNGKRGFFYDIWTKDPTYTQLEIPYTRALDRIISREFIEQEKKNPFINFAQEYECQFTTSLSSAFDEDVVNEIYKPLKMTDYSNIL